MLPSRVCVIGAGPSGLTAAKALHEQGLDFDCFEKGSGIGGLWRYNNDSGLSAAYQSLHINTSRKRTQFSDFPMPADYPDFPHHSQMLEYFEKYVDHFGFRHHISFGTTVRSVRPVGPDHWDVSWEDQRGIRRSRPYRAVLVANGHHWCPRYPEFAGEFRGHTLHSHDYRTAEGLQGKRVLVVGIGNSGCDIACESSRVAAATFLSTRSGAHIIPKYLFGKPLDRLCPEFIWRHTPRWLFKRLFALALRLARGRPVRFGLPQPKHRVLEEHPTISSDLFNLLGHGRIKIKPDIERLDGDGVCFRDGTRLPIDVIIYATGYQIRFPFLDEAILAPHDNEVPLYKLVVHPDHPGLYFIGLVQPWGSIMPLSELQSRWVSELLAGRTSLPDAESMRRDIQRSRLAMQREYTATPRHTIQVDYYRYVDALNRERRRPAAAAKPTNDTAPPLRRAA
jgi:dimethylaniline monooxygenase (N-oxide forming)